MSKFLCGCAVLALSMPAAGALAQSYPGKPVRWIVPFPPGGGTDTVSRTITQKLSEAPMIQLNNRSDPPVRPLLFALEFIWNGRFM